MSDTPEIGEVFLIEGNWNTFAKQLKRERDEREQRDEARDWIGIIARLERERDDARDKLFQLGAELIKIKTAAKAVVDRWDQPSWKDTEPTAAVINKLRNALEVQEE
jgi:hypothetical protein